ncbi:MAG: hypothetical protein C4518_19285 [Desulfobacteraceae bacterium]|nr:MAG: hypothetical protein C4518_19285 [Desulfobacteraceae bacterium]
MKELKNKVAAITGAASGIGQMLAVNLSAKGCAVAISDIDMNGLQLDAYVLDFLTRMFPKGFVRLAAAIAGRK